MSQDLLKPSKWKYLQSAEIRRTKRILNGIINMFSLFMDGKPFWDRECDEGGLVVRRSITRLKGISCKAQKLNDGLARFLVQFRRVYVGHKPGKQRSYSIKPIPNKLGSCLSLPLSLWLTVGMAGGSAILVLFPISPYPPSNSMRI